MKKFTKLASVLAATTAISATAAFADPFIAVGPKIGTQGIGIEGRAPVMENTYVRLGVNYFTYSRSHTIKNIGTTILEDLGYLNPTNLDADLPLKAKLNLMTAPLMVDYHPFDNSGFRVSAGVAYNGNNLNTKSATLVPTINNVPINDPQLNSFVSNLGTLKAKVKLGSAVAGLLTIGYDNSFLTEGAFSFACEAGVMFNGKSKVTVTGTGLLNNKEVIDYLNKKANKEFNSIKKYLTVYPIVSIGVKYSF